MICKLNLGSEGFMIVGMYGTVLSFDGKAIEYPVCYGIFMRWASEFTRFYVWTDGTFAISKTET